MKRKNILHILIAFIFFDIFSVSQTFGQNEQSATFVYKGNKGLAPQTCLYKIDNKTRTEYNSDFLAFGYNKSHKVGGFNIISTPGKHTFEMALTDKGVSSKPAKIIVRKVIIDMKPNYEYLMERNDFDIKITCSSNKAENVDYSIEELPVFTEPTEQFATIIYKPNAKLDINPYLTRIDDMVTPNLGDIFGTCNYSLPIDFKYFSGLKGELNLKISAGAHKIEYLLLGSAVFDGLVQVENFSFEAGKIYTIIVEETKIKREKIYTIKFVAK
jgi:hypothetical protein